MQYLVMVPQMVQVTLLPIHGKEVPDFVAQAFVGKSFPYFERVLDYSPTKKGISYAYKINKLAAVMILRDEEPDAAQWILDHPQVFSAPYLFFNEESCIPLETFCPQTCQGISEDARITHSIPDTLH